MLKNIFFVISALFIILVTVVVFFIYGLRPIEREGVIDLTQEKVESQIAKVVGKREIKNFSELLKYVQHPDVTQYTLRRDRTITDHDWRQISFKTEDSFDNVLNFYKSKFPTSEPSVETQGGPTEVYQYDEVTQKGTFEQKYVTPFRVAQFRIQIRQGKTEKSFLLFKLQKSGLSFRIGLTENAQENSTSVKLTTL